MMNDVSCVRVKRVQKTKKKKKEKRNGSVCYLCSKRGMCATIGYNTISQHRPVIPKVNAQMIFFMAQSQSEAAAVLWRKTHTACVEKQVGMRVPAQINIWLTLQSGYYLAEISEREVWGVSLCFFFLFFFCGYPRLRRCRNTGITGCNATPSSTLEKSTVTASLVLGQKRVKGKQKKKDR